MEKEKHDKNKFQKRKKEHDKNTKARCTIQKTQTELDIALKRNLRRPNKRV